MEQRSCPVCRRSFTPASANARFCPPTDEERARIKPGNPAASYCGKAYHNAKQRGRLATLLAEPRLPPEPFDCAQCGKRCEPGENVAAHATKFCGAECKRRWHAARQPYTYTRIPPRVVAARRKLKAARVIGAQRQFIEGVCARSGCGHRFIASKAASSVSHYCSEMCARRASRHRHRAKHGRIDQARKRARHYGVEYQPVSRTAIFERDGYRCGICGRKTKPDAKVPHPRAPTLDHVVPMSCGGPHTPANVQCACFECNWRKADGGGGEQLRLVG